MLKIERRNQTSRFWLYCSPILAIGLTLLTGAVLFSLMGKDPLAALYAYFILPIADLYDISEVLLKATPLIFIGLGLAFGFQAGVWNIGAEGQFIFGSLAASMATLFVFSADSSAWAVLPSLMICGALGGMLWAAIPALLRAYLNVNEILSSLMLNYVALLFLNFLVHGPWRDPMGMNFPQTALFNDNSLLPNLLEGYRVNIGFVLAVAMVVLFWFLMRSSMLGYQIRVFGFSAPAATYSGFSNRGIIITTMLLTGALAGIAGFHEVTGPIGQLTPSVASNYGYTAIIVAYLGRLHPVGVLFAALLMALSFIGAETAQMVERIPLAFNGVFQGLLLFYLIGCDFFINFRIKATRRHQ